MLSHTIILILSQNKQKNRGTNHSTPHIIPYSLLLKVNYESSLDQQTGQNNHEDKKEHHRN